MTDNVHDVSYTAHSLGQHRCMDHDIGREQFSEVFLTCARFNGSAEWMFRHGSGSLLGFVSLHFGAETPDEIVFRRGSPTATAQGWGAGGIGSAMSVARRHPSGVRTHSRIMRKGFGTGVCPA